MSGPIPYVLLGLLIGILLSVRSEATTAMTIRGVSRRGALSGVFAAGGELIADLLLLTAVSAIVLPAPSRFTGSGGLSTWLGVLAGGTLVLLGWRLVDDRRGGALSRERGEVVLRAYHRNLVMDGFIGAMLSPGRQLFWWTAGLRLVAGAAGAGGPGVVAFAVGIAAAGLGWPTFVAARLIDPMRERALSDRQYRIVTSLGGLVLASLGLGIGVRALAESGLREPLERIAATVFG